MVEKVRNRILYCFAHFGRSRVERKSSEIGPIEIQMAATCPIRGTEMLL